MIDLDKLFNEVEESLEKDGIPRDNYIMVEIPYNVESEVMEWLELELRSE